MAIDQEEDLRDYNVVVNHEEQYSIWFKDREIPAGWHIVDIPADWWHAYQEQHANVRGPHAKQVCLDYIEVIWTDMRPLSLRRAMDA
ncbi:hypothetical protein ASG87_18885 [Frateuria sp. Soil773]|uniref:MbtH family protein n=1 Tax=Frateuria sp. Soil773 TaxID=1736407 RepID=UPI0006F31004|nr:MbtH family NRPS accessory protein [Frateuria sp. Soil773]KRE90096.1 hypothetical protein ASG87_18885 [Frateuria sp. Soil773]